MIENYYALPIKNTLDVSAINVRKPKPRSKAKKADGQTEGQSQMDDRQS